MSHPMKPEDAAPARLRWARLRFSIIGTLLASPPDPGQLQRRISELASKSWKHPTTGEALRFEAPLPADFEEAMARLRVARR